MLVLSRKVSQQLCIDDNITITVLNSKRNLIQLGIEAPPWVSIRRAEIPPEQHCRPAVPATVHQGKPHQVLIVDDNPADRELCRRYISRNKALPVRVAETEFAEQGLEWCRKQVPDCILLDYRLPDLTGLDFLNELSRNRHLPHIPVIMMTGNGDEAVAVQAIKRGAHDYLPKNKLTPEHLQEKLRDALTNGVHAPTIETYGASA